MRQKKLIFISISFFILILFQFSCDVPHEIDSQVNDAASPPYENDDESQPFDEIENPHHFDGGINLGQDSGDTFEDQNLYNTIPQYCNGLSSVDLNLNGFEMRNHEMRDRIGDIHLSYDDSRVQSDFATCDCVDWVPSQMQFLDHKEIIQENYTLCSDHTRTCPNGQVKNVGEMTTFVDCISPIFASVSFRDFDNLAYDPGARVRVHGYIDNSNASNGSACHMYDSSGAFFQAAQNARDEAYNGEGPRPPLSQADYVLLTMNPEQAGGIYFIEKRLRFYEESKRLGGAVILPLVDACLIRRRGEVSYSETTSVLGSTVNWVHVNEEGVERNASSPISNDPTLGQGIISENEDGAEALRQLLDSADPMLDMAECLREALEQIYRDTVDHWYESQPVPYDPIAQADNQNEDNLIRNKDVDGDGACNLIDWCDDGAIRPEQWRINPALNFMQAAEGRIVDIRDQDGDGIANICDLCPTDALEGDPEWELIDALQRRVRYQDDRDLDGRGDSCDVCPEGDDRHFDGDNDRVCLARDNCPGLSNPSQADFDEDGSGDACDACPAVPNSVEGLDLTTCQIEGDADPRITDSDGDDIIDQNDNCVHVYNPLQTDDNDNGIGDLCEEDCEERQLGFCDNDIDDDDILNEDDNCPEDSNWEQRDADNDNVGDVCDLDCRDEDRDGVCDEEFSDEDGDGHSDDLDNCPEDSNPLQIDLDFDDAGFVCDNCRDLFNPDQSDRDNDGVGDACDYCPDDYDPSNHDQDGDGIGDICEEEPCIDLNGDGACSEQEYEEVQDSDGDGILDREEVAGCEDVVNLGFDMNENGIDDACDPDCFDVNGDGVNECHRDRDEDGVLDREDNCPDTYNPEQENTGGIRNRGDHCEDRDFDNILDFEDRCPDLRWTPQSRFSDLRDRDGDGLGDNCDNCIDSFNPGQEDFDNDGIGSACQIVQEEDPEENDRDFDGIPDDVDPCPDDRPANGEFHEDLNENGIGDDCDGSFDFDNDGVSDLLDNCYDIPNATQIDTDNDGVGNVCDHDSDDDGIDDEIDNCPLIPNPHQRNEDGDSQGDVCDDGSDEAFDDLLDDLVEEGNDRDGDGIPDEEDNCPESSNPDQIWFDQDGDGIHDLCDNCPDVFNPGQEGINGFGGDACQDNDDDNIYNHLDNCPNFPNPDQADEDGDGRGDACAFEDADNDGIDDEIDNCLGISNDQEDLDGDGRGDACDDDIDGDGIPNEFDNCFMTPNPDQLNSDGDTIGDACERQR